MEKKLNVKKIAVAVFVLLVIIFVAYKIISNAIETSNYHKTNEYKLSEIGYTENEVKLLLNKLSEEQIADILKLKYNVALTKFLEEKYFIYSNLNRYLDYYNDNKDISISDVVAIVNVGADKDWYENIKETDISKGNLMLVNKFYKLGENYVPEDIQEIPGYYALDGMYMSASIYDSLTDMLDAARNAGFTLVVTQGYRSYEEQYNTYKEIEDYNDTRYADVVAARAGHSEYQTGLGVMIEPYGKVVEDAKVSEEYKWLMANCHKYGFILRYPEGKEKLTGFNYSPWRFRYVGVDASSKIHNENITFDEYYAYYINK